MYIDRTVLDRLESVYGVPLEFRHEDELSEREFRLCRHAMRRGRAHDVTLFILRGEIAGGDLDRAERQAPIAGGGAAARSAVVLVRCSRGDQIAVIRKWSYPSDIYRPPSGGVEPEEPFEVGAAREAYEETGLTVTLDRYLVRALARFSQGDETLDWTTHVFGARYVEGEIRPVDEREIAEARWATLTELDSDLRDAMLATGSAGFRYRVALQDAALRVLGLKE